MDNERARYLRYSSILYYIYYTIYMDMFTYTYNLRLHISCPIISDWMYVCMEVCTPDTHCNGASEAVFYKQGLFHSRT